jgi:membrane protein DedA with SNARE-associated domain
MHDLFHRLFEWYGHALDSWGYLAVVLLMAMESTIFPLPSELIIPPAAILAQRSGNLTLTGIVIAGALGSWLGATAMYWVSRWAGRPLVLKYGRYFLIAPAKVEQAERWTSVYGDFGVFASRLLPVVRHLIGIPAGIVRMPYGRFSLYTLVGSALWCGVLCWIGVKAGQDEALMRGELRSITFWAAGLLGLLGVIYYFFVHRHMQAAKK